MLRIHGTKLSQSKFSWMSWLGLAGAVSCCALVLVFGLMLFPSLPQVTYAAIPEVTPSTGTSVGINLPASIDFDSITPTPDGATTTATADLTVTTTNSASYSLYLYSSDGDNSLRPKISANTSSIIATAGGVGLTLSSLEPNTWGYNLGTSVPDDDTTYSAIPTDNSTPIQTKDTSSTNSANDTYTLSFGAKVDTSIPSGAYSNTLTIAVVAEPAFVTIAFNGNGADGGNMASIQMIPEEQRNLPQNSFTKSGYFFTGWNTSPNGSGTSYADGASYTAPTESAGETVTLYAQWHAEFAKNTMQGFTFNDCQSLASSSNVTLTDVRDNNAYTVRYINGVCWMVQNLRLSNGRTLTPIDSNVESNWYFPTTDLTAGDSQTEARSHAGTDATTGYWYNMCAASAGTACASGNGNYQDVIYDICPRGWRLPTWGDGSKVLAYIDVFSPVAGGYYDGGSLTASDWGIWWLSGAYRSGYDTIDYRGSTFDLSGHYSERGNYVRCVRSS